MTGHLTIDRATLERLRAHAASAARLVGHLDDALATGPLGAHVDAIAHELGELLGNPHLRAAPVPSVRSTLALDIVTQDGVPELVAPDAPGVSRTHALITDDCMRHEHAELSEPSELVSAFTDDESTRTHVRQLRAAHGRPCQRVVRRRRPVHRRQRLGVEKVLTTSGTRHLDSRWVRSAIAAAVLALLGVISLLVLGACQVEGP